MLWDKTIRIDEIIKTNSPNRKIFKRKKKKYNECSTYLEQNKYWKNNIRKRREI